MKKIILGIIILIIEAASVLGLATGSITPFGNNISTTASPTFTGIATDDASGVASIECRIDGGTFYPATYTSGSIGDKTVSFSYAPSGYLARCFHTLETRFKDNSGNVTPAGSYLSYSFRTIGSWPEIDLYIEGNPVIDGDPILPQPSIEAVITSSNTLDTISLILDGAAPISLTKVPDPTNPYINYGFYKPTTNLADGNHNIIIQAKDTLNHLATSEYSYLAVNAATDTVVQSVPLNYPNPFNPDTGTSISYMLSKNSDITISIHNIYGAMLWKQSYASGSSGGIVGYNEVAWNGQTNSGSAVGNGMYIYLITANNKLLAKGKMVAFKR